MIIVYYFRIMNTTTTKDYNDYGDRKFNILAPRETDNPQKKESSPEKELTDSDRLQLAQQKIDEQRQKAETKTKNNDKLQEKMVKSVENVNPYADLTNQRSDAYKAAYLGGRKRKTRKSRRKSRKTKKNNKKKKTNKRRR